jgi:lipopolysaccharide/colanic/teichoic acid biosynthesis glycosyltransferase
MIKRLFDLLAAAVALALLSPVLLVVALLVWATSRGPVFFRQERIGRDFRPFRIYKFRSMVHDAPRKGNLVTFGADPRITKVGRILRATKIDELPQLSNVLVGEMSRVGPRPEVRKYVEMFREDYAEVLRVRPGITDPASIKYRHEAEILGHAADPEREYVQHVLPEKIRLGKEYAKNSSLWLDLMIILKTLHVVGRGARSTSFARSPNKKPPDNETATAGIEPESENKTA